MQGLTPGLPGVVVLAVVGAAEQPADDGLSGEPRLDSRLRLHRDLPVDLLLNLLQVRLQEVTGSEGGR
jgi:hypothetical protein